MHGSLATGDYDPASSDVDMLLVVAEPPTDAEAGALERAPQSRRREHGRSLLGPQPSTLISPLPHGPIVAYGDEVLARWEGLTGDAKHARFMVLTTCRIWLHAVEGRHASKPGAARWALARDPSLNAVAHALADDPISPEEIAALLARVRMELVSDT